MENTIQQLSAEEKLQLIKKLLSQKVVQDQKQTKLSYGQQALLFMHLSAPENTAYNVSFAATVASVVAVEALRAAGQLLVNRHEVLRTTYSYAEGQPTQTIHGYQDLSFFVFPATGYTDEQLNASVRAAHEMPFDLAQGPVFRMALFTRQPDEHVLLLTVHHIAADGRSMMLLVDELKEFYAAEVQATQVSALPPSHSFVDFVAYEQAKIDSEAGNRMLAYWQETLKGELAVLQLPTDFPRPTVQHYEGKAVMLNLDETLTRQLRFMAQAEGVTLYVFLLTCYKVLLYRYSGQEDLIVGTPVLGRTTSVYQKAIGNYMNSMPVRTSPVGTLTFRAFLQEVKTAVLGAITHADYPFALLVKQVNVPRDSSRTPVFQTMFNIQKPLEEKGLHELLIPGRQSVQINWGGLLLSPFDFTQQEGLFDLMLDLVETPPQIFGTLKYNTGIFEASTAERLVNQLQYLIRQVLQNPDQTLHTYSLLTPPETTLITEQWNKTDAAYETDKGVVHLFDKQVAIGSQQGAIRFKDATYSYATVQARSLQLASVLQHQYNVTPGDRVALLLERSEWMLITILAIWRTGAAYVPIDPDYPADRIGLVIADCEAKIVIGEAAHLDSVDHPQKVALPLLLTASHNQPIPPVFNYSKADDLAYLIYTSGSTGKPKGVMISQGALVNFLSSMAQRPGLQKQQVLLAVTTFSFDISLLEFFLPLTTGAMVRVLDKQTVYDPQLLQQVLAEERHPVLQATPSLWQMLIDGGWAGHTQLIALTGGEPINQELARKLVDRSLAVWNMYGPTETTVWSTCCEITNESQEISIGTPIANTQVYVLDQQLAPVPVGVPGELYIGGDGVAVGYWNRSELTTERFVNNPFVKGRKMYRTGDVVRWKANGHLVYLGRNDSQVKIRGYRIELGEVEQAVQQQEGISQAVAVVREDKPDRKVLVAYYTCFPNATADLATIRKGVRQRLPGYMVPSAFVKLDFFPQTPNGKIDRKQLPAPEFPNTDTTVQPPGQVIGTLEKSLVAIWKEVLGIEQISISDNFFDLGGHSILLVEVHNKLRQSVEPSLAVSIIDLFRFPTIEALAFHLRQVPHNSQDLAVVDRGQLRNERKVLTQQQRQIRRQNRDKN